MTCSNTYAAYARPATQAADGTPCDNGGTIVNSKSSARNMTWWDLAYLGNMVAERHHRHRLAVELPHDGVQLREEPDPRTASRLNNSANFHVVPSGVDGLTVWGVKVQTPSLAAFANPAGNGNPLYTGALFNEDNVKNTDAFDPGSASQADVGQADHRQQHDLGRHDLLRRLPEELRLRLQLREHRRRRHRAQGQQQPQPGRLRPARHRRQPRRPLRPQVRHRDRAQPHLLGPRHLDRQRDQRRRDQRPRLRQLASTIRKKACASSRTTRAAARSATSTTSNICIRDALNALLFTPYYSTKALPAAGPLYPELPRHLSGQRRASRARPR